MLGFSHTHQQKGLPVWSNAFEQNEFCQGKEMRTRCGLIELAFQGLAPRKAIADFDDGRMKREGGCVLPLFPSRKKRKRAVDDLQVCCGAIMGSTGVYP